MVLLPPEHHEHSQKDCAKRKVSCSTLLSAKALAPLDYNLQQLTVIQAEALANQHGNLIILVLEILGETECKADNGFSRQKQGRKPRLLATPDLL